MVALLNKGDLQSLSLSLSPLSCSYTHARDISIPVDSSSSSSPGVEAMCLLCQGELGSMGLPGLEGLPGAKVSLCESHRLLACSSALHSLSSRVT